MVAFSASRLVWLAMSLISFTASPIFCAAADRPCTVTLVRFACSTAWPAILVDSATSRPISETEDDSSSVAAATVCTLAEACSATAATVVA